MCDSLVSKKLYSQERRVITAVLGTPVFSVPCQIVTRKAHVSENQRLSSFSRRKREVNAMLVHQLATRPKQQCSSYFDERGHVDLFPTLPYRARSIKHNVRLARLSPQKYVHGLRHSRIVASPPCRVAVQLYRLPTPHTPSDNFLEPGVLR